MTTEDVKELFKLPAEERLDIAQALWDSVDPEERARLLSLPDWQRRVLRHRLADLDRNPGDEQPWDEVREELWPKGTSRFPAFAVPADAPLISAARVQKALDDDGTA
jgi:putative addiction module component (TIGR02574 family)